MRMNSRLRQQCKNCNGNDPVQLRLRLLPIFSEGNLIQIEDLCQFFFMEPIVPCSKPQYGAEFSTFTNGAVSNKNYIRGSQKLKNKPANSQEAHHLKSKLLGLSEYLRGTAHLQQLQQPLSLLQSEKLENRNKKH